MRPASRQTRRVPLSLGHQHAARHCLTSAVRAGGRRSRAHPAAHSCAGHHRRRRVGAPCPGGEPLTLRLSDTGRARRAGSPPRLRLEANHNAAWHPQFLRLKPTSPEHRLGAPQHVVAIQNVPLARLRAGAHAHWMFDQPRDVLFDRAPSAFSDSATSWSGEQRDGHLLRRDDAQDRSDVLRDVADALAVRRRHGATVHGLRRAPFRTGTFT